MSISIGQLIDGRYEIVRLIGEGGMGAVYEGQNTFIRRRVAIKVLHSALSADQALVQRFEREAQAAGHIGSDHILEVLDLGLLPDGSRYLVMEYLDGEPLSDRIQRHGRLSPHELLPLLSQALVGLSAAHRAGIVHRDLKPDNLFILKEKAGRTDFVKIIDFGISKFQVLGGDMSMTRTGALMGTPYYMSPEQAKGASNVTAQSDLYSLGVIAFEALTGKVPFDGTTFNELMFKIVLAPAPDPEELCPGLDPAFSAIVQRAMHREASARFQTAEDFLAALERWSPMARTAADGTPFTVQGEFGATLAGPTAPFAFDGGRSQPPTERLPDPSNPPAGVWSGVPLRQVPVWAWGVGGAAVLLLGLSLALSGGDDAPRAGTDSAGASTPVTVPPVEPPRPAAASPSLEPSAPPAPQPPAPTPPPALEAASTAQPATETEAAPPPPPSAAPPVSKPAPTSPPRVAPPPAAASKPKPKTAPPPVAAPSTPAPASKPPPRPSTRDFGY